MSRIMRAEFCNEELYSIIRKGRLKVDHRSWSLKLKLRQSMHHHSRQELYLLMHGVSFLFVIKLCKRFGKLVFKGLIKNKFKTIYFDIP